MTKQELASRIWSMADKMRTKIKASEYKDYILGVLFYKYLSDKQEAFMRSEGATNQDIANMDESDMVHVRENLGYAIMYKDLFSTWKQKGIALDAKTVSEALDAFNRNIDENYASSLKDIFSTLQNGVSKMGDSSGARDQAVRAMVDMIDKIPTIGTEGYDVIGYIYEFLIYKFSTAAKDDGAFYTPHEVSRLISMCVAEACKNKEELAVYDPTAGSGSLLRTVGEEASQYIKPEKIKYFGQELITETYNLCRMNLIMKNVPSQNICVRNGDTLADDWPYFDEHTAYQPLRVDAVVSNPPYSLHYNPDEHINDDRFKKYGLAPAGKADFAFLLHCLYHLKPDGVMGIVLPHGVLFRGDSEYQIRRNLCLEHNIETIISLPQNLFFATSIPTVIILLRRNRQADDILFIDASQSYEKGKNQNVLRECDIKRIFDAVKERKDIDHFARLVPFEEIEKNDFNLNIPRYISASKEAETYDLAATMSGTIPESELDECQAAWAEFPSLKAALFKDAGNGYLTLKDVDIKGTIAQNTDVEAFKESFAAAVDTYRTDLQEVLIHDNYANLEKILKNIASDRLFELTNRFPIVNRYDVYQLLMNHWPMIENDMREIGKDLSKCREVEPNIIIKKAKKEDIEVQDGWKGTILPFALVGETFFQDEYEKVANTKSKIQSLEAERDSIYDGLSDEAKAAAGDGEKFKEADLKKYFKNGASDDEKVDLQNAMDCISQIKILIKEIKDADIEITQKIKDKIGLLTDDEIKTLLMKKWVEPVCNEILAAPKQVTDHLVKTVEALQKKYGRPLSAINREIEDVNAQLCQMLDQLTGSEIDMEAIRMLKEVL